MKWERKIERAMHRGRDTTARHRKTENINEKTCLLYQTDPKYMVLRRSSP